MMRAGDFGAGQSQGFGKGSGEEFARCELLTGGELGASEGEGLGNAISDSQRGEKNRGFSEPLIGASRLTEATPGRGNLGEFGYLPGTGNR